MSVHHEIASRLLAWFRGAQRDLPWRRTRDAYAIWVSEVMLQQTRVDTVIPYYARFLEAFPSVEALAEAGESDVLAQWSGLGYYRRARMLHQGAQMLAASCDGVIPADASALQGVPGIGRYTAGAIASIAFGQATPLVDGNVARVIARLFALRHDVGKGGGRERVWELARELIDAPEATADPGAFNQSLMELGALVCVPREPRCEACPVRSACRADGLGLARELPLVVAKSAPKAWARVALVATGAAGVLLARRASTALMGGLWEPPMIDAAGEPERAAVAIAKAVGARISGPRRGPAVKHLLTHRRMNVEVVSADLATARLRRTELPAEYDAVAVAADYAQLPMSTLAKKLLARVV